MAYIPIQAKPAIRIPTQALLTSYIQPRRVPFGRGIVQGNAKINGTPVVDTEVALLHAASGVAVRSTLTDSDGNYLFTEVGEGHYSVVVIDPIRGYRSRVGHTYVEHVPEEPVLDPSEDPNGPLPPHDPQTPPPPVGTPQPPPPPPPPLVMSGFLAPAYVGIPYFNGGELGDPWSVSGGDYPRVTGSLPPGLTVERGTSSRLRVNVYGIPLEPFDDTITLDIGGTVHSQRFIVRARPAFDMLDFSRRREASGAMMNDAHSVSFRDNGGVLSYQGASSGLLYAEILTSGGGAIIGVHAANLDNPFVSDTGNPAGTYGIRAPAGDIRRIALNASDGKLWISDGNGVFAGDPAAGTGQTATLSLANSTDGRYRIGVYGYAGDSAIVNMGTMPWIYGPPSGFEGWPLHEEAVPAIWTSTGALHAQVGSATSGQVPTGTVAGILDSSRTAPSPGTYGGLRATLGKSTGRWQFEIRAAGDASSAIGPTLSLGMVESGFDFTAGKAIGYVGATDSIGIAHTHPDAQTRQEYTEVHTNFDGVHTAARYERVEQCTYTFAFDADAGTLGVYRNGLAFVTVEGIPTGEWFPAMSANWWPRAELEVNSLKYPIEGYANWSLGEVFVPQEPEEPSITATWDPATASARAALVAQNSVLSLGSGSGSYGNARGSHALSGLAYFSARVHSTGSGEVVAVGVADASWSSSSASQWAGSGASAGLWAPANGGAMYVNGAVVSAFSSGALVDDDVQFAVRTASRRVWVRRAGGPWLGGGDPVADVSPTCTLAGSGAIFPAATVSNAGSTVALHGDAASTTGIVPTGFEPAGWVP